MADGLVLFEAGHAGCTFLQELGMACEFKVGNILEAMTNELQNEFPDCRLEFQPSLTITVSEHVVRLILLLGILWWMKSSSIFDNGYCTV
jgi:hypothetical protein